MRIVGYDPVALGAFEPVVLHGCTPSLLLHAVRRRLNAEIYEQFRYEGGRV